MIKISKSEREALDEVGLLKYHVRTKNGGFQDSNITVVNKFHNGSNKHYYVVESPEIMAFLGHYDELNLQVIRKEQLQILIDKGLVKDINIQHPGEYKPSATVYIDTNGKIRCKKITENMLAMGIWKKKNFNN